MGEAFSLEKVDAPLGLRLRAWWEGCPVSDLAPEDSQDEIGADPPVAPGDTPEPSEDSPDDPAEPDDGRY